MEPAATIITKLGGDKSVALACNCVVSTVCRWRLPVEQGGTGGAIPTRRLRQLLRIAKERGVDITPADMILSQTGEGV